MDMQIDILTLFPESVDAMLNVSILGRAQERGYIAIRTHQIRAYTTNKQVVFMHQGVICEQGTPAQVFGDPQQRETKEFLTRFRGVE